MGIARFTIKLASFPESRKTDVINAWRQCFPGESPSSIRDYLEHQLPPYLLVEDGNAKMRDSVVAAFESIGAPLEVTERDDDLRLHLLDSAAKLLRVAASSLGETGQEPTFGRADLNDVRETLLIARSRIKEWTNWISSENGCNAFVAVDLLRLADLAIDNEDVEGCSFRTALVVAAEKLELAIHDNERDDDAANTEQEAA